MGIQHARCSTYATKAVHRNNAGCHGAETCQHDVVGLKSLLHRHSQTNPRMPSLCAYDCLVCSDSATSTESLTLAPSRLTTPFTYGKIHIEIRLSLNVNYSMNEGVVSCEEA